MADVRTVEPGGGHEDGPYEILVPLHEEIDVDGLDVGVGGRR
jgi:hypothetical protein